MFNCSGMENENTFLKSTSGYLFANPDTAISSLKTLDFEKEFGNNPKLIFQPFTQLDTEEKRQIWEQQVDLNLLPIEIRRQKEGIPSTLPCNFDISRFYKRLGTKIFGRFLVYVPVCESTMNISESLSKAFPNIDGILVVTGCQTAGRGRSGNLWVGPFGAALFTINLVVPFDSSISKSLVLIQHLIAVSICKAVTEFIPDFPIRIKWPNDIYYKREFKLGGILISSSQSENEFNCFIGVGLNISNSNPTICINDLISENIKKLETEEIIAQIMNKFEDQLEFFKLNGFSSLKREYENFWLHKDEKVSVRLDADIEEKVTIKGIDENGYLLVLKESGEYESVMDNGNRFDLLQGLIFQNRN